MEMGEDGVSVEGLDGAGRGEFGGDAGGVG